MSEVNGRHEAVAVVQDDPNVPVVPAAVRTTVYMVVLAINVLSILVFGLGTVFGLIDAGQAAAAAGVVAVAINTVSSALAVGYRPTRPGA